MTEFLLHPQLEKESLFVRDLPLSQVRLNNQKAVPWLILVPRRTSIREIYELNHIDRIQLIEEMGQASRAIVQLYAPDKINIGALGNIVPQLHVHVIGRFTTDEVWPAPVWGRLTPESYSAEAAQSAVAKLSDHSLWG